MPKPLKVLIQIIIFLLPWRIRRMLLNKLFSYDIDKKAFIGFSIILADKIIMKSNSKILHFNFCNGISFLSMDKSSSIGTFNYITGFPNIKSFHFNHIKNRTCHLILGQHSAITSRHFIDCTTGVFIGNYTTIAGICSQLFTHSINLKKNIQDGQNIHIGDYCFVGTRVVILPGSVLPNFCVLGASSVLNKKFTEEYTLYAGNPSEIQKSLNPEEYLYFSRTSGFVY